MTKRLPALPSVHNALLDADIHRRRTSPIGSRPVCSTCAQDDKPGLPHLFDGTALAVDGREMIIRS
jgi:hypothetical protein